MRSLLVCAALAVACAATGERRHTASFERLWERYRQLPDERALVIAGDPERHWVGSALGGYATRAAVESAAFAECDARRVEGRIEAPCRLYAFGDEVVYRPRK